MAKRTVRLTLEVSTDLNDTLDNLANNSSSTKSDVLRKAIALFEFASAGKLKGRALALIDPKTEKILSHIVGI